MVSDLIIAPPLWLFLALAAGVALVRWSNRPYRAQALVILVALSLMALPGGNLWEFGVWVVAAYVVDLVGDDAAPGTFLAMSAIFYPAIALGFNPWWCQLASNLFGCAALGVIGGMGGGILAGVRFGRSSGTDIVGRVWICRAA
jgi:hypothetical protein